MIAGSLASDRWRTDIVGRWSEDEFLVILNADGAELLVTLAQELGGLPNILKNSDDKLSADETAPENNRPAGESHPAAKQ